MVFKLKTCYRPEGDQPQAIKNLLKNFNQNHRQQIVLGATGTGKTFTIANIIQKLNKKTLVIAHNKTLAGQLYSELKDMFPDNKVEYFISYYDFYQPEAYVVSTDTYIEKDALINDEIDQLRHHAINSLINYEDVIVVASVSCIYGIGDIQDYKKSFIHLSKGQKYLIKDIIKQLINLQYQRNDFELKRGTFRVRGNMLEIVLASGKNQGIRIIFFDNEIAFIKIFDVINKIILYDLLFLTIFPASLYVSNPAKLAESISRIREELTQQIAYFKSKNQLVEMKKIKNKTNYDLEMLQELGYCNGIENYSQHLALKNNDEPPTTLLDYFGNDFLTIIDESHVTLSQIKGMYFGNRARKENLINYGFRLPSSLNNRPLKFEEFEVKMDKIIYLSATPGKYELKKKIPIVEQIIRPTFVLDPQVEVRSTFNQIEDLYFEIKKRAFKKERTLVTTITMNLSEELTNYLKDLGIKVAFLHSEIKSLKRLWILNELRRGVYDCLIGVNLLREGLDLPEVSLVVILDADKQGFLRNDISLIQIIGRAARNINGYVIMYADSITPAMKKAILETKRRRQIQIQYNEKNQVVPKPIHKKIIENIKLKTSVLEEDIVKISQSKNNIETLKKLMKEAAHQLDFEKAVIYRDLMQSWLKSKK
ncbi:excinuclease ABC subunit B [Candidatus Phytoplasma phoenicium]|uniref:UvrABC system protein B n=1 Tax=Candidatus Phytoplasma phoenicium TaxID=198422 RepID=A0A2S8NVG1_9MOLU|nr:excinuclease ABC subunit B [Candidatus Phytoplasma phoenicium]